MKITIELLKKHNVSPEDILFYSSTRIVGMEFSEVQLLKLQKNPALQLVHNSYYSLLDYYIDDIKAIVKAENKGQLRFDCTEIIKEESSYHSEHIDAAAWSNGKHHIDRCSYKKLLHDMVISSVYDDKDRESIRIIKDSYNGTIRYMRNWYYLYNTLLSVKDHTGNYTFVYTKDYKKLLNILYQSTVIM